MSGFFYGLPKNKASVLDFVLESLHEQARSGQALSQTADWLAHKLNLPYPEAINDSHYQDALEILVAEARK